MTARSVLADTLNRVLGLELTDFEGARAWVPAGGWDRLGAWLASHPDTSGSTTRSVTSCASAETRQPDRSPTERTTR